MRQRRDNTWRDVTRRDEGMTMCDDTTLLLPHDSLAILDSWTLLDSRTILDVGFGFGRVSFESVKVFKVFKSLGIFESL